MQGCTGGEPCPGLLSEDEPSQGPRSVGGRQGLSPAFIRSRVGAAQRSFSSCRGPQFMGPCEGAEAVCRPWVRPRVLYFHPTSHPPRRGQRCWTQRGRTLGGGLVGGGGWTWGRGPRGTSPKAPGAVGCARPGTPLGDAVGDGRCLVWTQAGSSCRGIALVLLLFLCCSFSLASTTWTHAPGTATALWMLRLQPTPQPELLPSRDEHSAPADSHPARGRCVARGGRLRAARPPAPRPASGHCVLSSRLL